MRILLIDDHHLIGRSLEISLKSYSEISDFFYLSDPEKALEVVDSYVPSIILMDIHMGEHNGLEIGSQILQNYPVKLVFLSGFSLIEYKERAFKIGAHGFFDKHIEADDLVDNLKIIQFENKKIFPEFKAKGRILLTDREKEILQLISQGVKQTAVASELGISERTVRNHMYSVSEKLQTSTVVESVIKAIELGIINVRLQ